MNIAKIDNTKMSTNTYYLNDEKYTYEYFCQKNVCRLCWKATKTSISIANDVILAQNIEEHIGISVTGHILQSVCSTCAEKVESFNNFIKFCQEADERLDRILAAAQMKERFEDCYHDSSKVRKEAHLELKLLALKSQENCFNLKKGQINYNLQELQPSDDEFLPNEDRYCYSCILKFDSVESKKDHDIRIHKMKQNNSFKCNLCYERFSKFSTQLIHEIKCSTNKIHSGIKRKLELKTVKQEKESVRSNLNQSESNVISCHLCSEKFENANDYSTHQLQHRKDKFKRICEVCGRVLLGRHSLADHMKIHTGHKEKCPHCNYTATLKVHVSAHIRRVHIRERKFACHICPLRCFTKNNLTVHLKTHFGIKDFKCTLCPKTYTTKIALQEHIKVFHEGLVGQYKCGYCTSQFNSIDHLRRHMIKRHGRKAKVFRGSLIEVDDSETGDGNTNQECTEEMMGDDI